MMDESIAAVHPSNWSRLVELHEDLASKIGRQGFEHQVVHPIDCLTQVAGQIKDGNFSSIIDLTGWLTPAIRELFPSTPIINEFSLSRVRLVSSPMLETTGYTVSHMPHELKKLRDVLDLSRPLIVDDVSFSGWTSRKTMELWGIDPTSATHAFLIANTGDLGPNPGAVKMLEGIGSKVISGLEITTPNDDGWHMKDLFWHSRMEDAFILAMRFQELATIYGQDAAELKSFLADDHVSKILFPESYTSSQIRDLKNEGKFVLLNGGTLQEGSRHARNPFLWASFYLRDHLDLDSLRENRLEILSTLRELRELTSDPEGQREAAIELMREVGRVKQSGLEGRRLGKER